MQEFRNLFLTRDLGWGPESRAVDGWREWNSLLGLNSVNQKFIEFYYICVRLLGVTSLGKYKGGKWFVSFRILKSRWKKHLGKTKLSGFIVSLYKTVNIMWCGLCCLLFPSVASTLYSLYILSFSLFMVFTAPEWLLPFPLPECLWSQICL